MIVASELVENAVVHARTGCRLAIRLDDRGLTIAVRDRGPFTVLHPRPGHGLFMVAEVSRAWDVSPTEEGKSVWALLPIAGSTGGLPIAGSTGGPITDHKPPDPATCA